MPMPWRERKAPNTDRTSFLVLTFHFLESPFMKITFLGAAGEVTGSQHLIETDAFRILLDCGLFQGHRGDERRKNGHLSLAPKSLSGVILSHAHADHCGNLPGLFRAGYRGPIFCTP